MKNLFENAKFITTEYEVFNGAIGPWGERRPELYQHTDIVAGDGLPYFVKDFTLDSVEKTVLHFTALGCCDIYINGKRAGLGEMKPGWTDYNTRTLYMSYDITDDLTEGGNRILAVLSPGWYSGRISNGTYGSHAPAFAASIVSGGKEIFFTDESWVSAVGGETRFTDIWDGEYIDAREPSYASMSVYKKALRGRQKTEIFDYAGEITPFVGPEIRVREKLGVSPARLTVTDGTVYNGTYYGKVNICEDNAALPLTLKKGQKLTVDLGQEIVGRLRIGASSVRGNVLKIRYAEFLNDSGSTERGNDGPEGSVYTINLRSALGKEFYVFKDKKSVEFSPRFTFYGFRYAEISAKEDVVITAINGDVIGNDTKETGSVTTSHKVINRLISNIIWGQRGNYLSVPTDCPQRDERLGWTGDAQAFSVTAAYNADVYGFFLKWMQDMRDSQGESGGYADINPRLNFCSGDDAVGWGDAGIIIPYNMYIQFGDTRILKEHFDSMKKYVDGLIEKYGMRGPMPRYNDWLAYDYCSGEFLSSAYLVHDLDLMIVCARAIGKDKDAERYESLRKKAYSYFKKNFLKKGKPAGSTQTDKVICLAFDLLDKDIAPIVAQELSEQIKANGDRLSTGFLGTYNLCPALSKYGQDKTAYNLVLQRNEPSWLYSVDQGATTIWERWNSYTKAKGFGDVGMNSFNHYAYGAVGEWMYRFMAGIEPGEPGFKSILLQPRPDFRSEDELPEGQENIKFVKASYKSASGLIKSEWSTENGFVYRCSVPKGVTAKLLLPATGKKIIVNGKALSKQKYSLENGKYIINLAQGKYEFTQK